MTLFFLIFAIAGASAVWPLIAAYSRRAIARRQIAAQGVALPFVAVLFLISIGVFSLKLPAVPGWLWSGLVIAVLAGYPALVVATIMRAYRAPVESRPHGFPVVFETPEKDGTGGKSR